jgi:hypothetical protein
MATGIGQRQEQQTDAPDDHAGEHQRIRSAPALDDEAAGLHRGDDQPRRRPDEEAGRADRPYACDQEDRAEAERDRERPVVDTQIAPARQTSVAS